MIHPNRLILSLFFLISTAVFSQQSADEPKSNIATILENYFDLEREAIHLHLDKTTFINNEVIWYQGYIINRKTNKPYFTTNVFVILFDEKGKQLSEKLVYATNGIFSGNIELNSKLESGNYYIQVYTNWMNNFSENESTLLKVNIINPEQGIRNNKKIVKETLEINLNPEGKSYVAAVSNTIGIQVNDCNQNAPKNLEVSIQNSTGEELQIVKLNQFGFGKFTIIPSAENLRAVIKYEDIILEKNLPQPEVIGLALEINTFSIDTKTAIKIKTNQSSFEYFKSKALTLVIHQDEKHTVYPLQINSNQFEQTLVVKNSDLKTGINTIRIIDNTLKQWCERLIYINPIANYNCNIVKSVRNGDKINLAGYSESQNTTMSISVLPKETNSIDENNSIIAGLTINPYLNASLLNANYYFNNATRLKYYELDLVLLNQENLKYNWNYMKLQPPISNYSFDVGINLKGTIDASIKNKTSHKVKLVTYKDLIIASADVSEKGEYEFQNLLLTDSTYVNLSLQKLPNFEEINTKLSPQVINRKKSFYKLFTGINRSNCILIDENSDLLDLDLPTFDGQIIKLDEVVLKNKKVKLTYEKILSNTMLRAYKIDNSNNQVSILSFIEQNGFVVSREIGNVQISARGNSSLNSANPTPLVFIDERQLYFNFDELELLQMINIDEIYIDPRAIVASINNNQGIIKIYTKKPKNSYFSKSNPNSFFIKEAFSNNDSFKNSDYQSTLSKGFDNFGIIGWSPKIKSDEKGNFLFSIIDYNKQNCKVIIEGMTSDGQLFHEEKIVELK